MIKYILTFIFFLPFLAVAQTVPVVIDNPGAGGMQSNYGINTLNPDQLWYALNVDYWTTPGMIKKRKGIVPYGNNNISLYGAIGFHDYTFDKKYIFGVKSHDSLAGAGLLAYSDAFSAGLQDNDVAEWIFSYEDVRHNWLKVRNILIHCDGKSYPIGIIGTSERFIGRESENQAYPQPRAISLGLEAPGQPRVMEIDTTGNLTGVYQYAFGFNGPPGIPSRPISVDSGMVLISNIPATESAILGMDTVYILRRKLGSNNSWFKVDSLENPQDSFPRVYIDTLADYATVPIQTHWIADTTVIDTLHNLDSSILIWYTGWWDGDDKIKGFYCYDENLPKEPGDCHPYYTWYNWTFDSITASTHWWLNDADSGIAGDSCSGYCGTYRLHPYTGAQAWPWDSTTNDYDKVIIDTTFTVWGDSGGYQPGQLFLMNDSADTNFYTRCAYSFYDPQTGIESPLGPSCALPYDDTEDTLYSCSLRTAIIDLKTNPAWIRVYTNDTGGTAYDTLVWLPVFQGRVNDFMGHGDTVVIPGIHDSDIYNGLDSSMVDSSFGYHFFYDRQPPYKWDCPIPALDMAYMDGRLWAIGDPEQPWRMYWTDVNVPAGYAFSSWRPGNVYDFIDDGYGALIDLEMVAGGNAFYAFKRNAVYLVTPGPQVTLLEGDNGPVSVNAITRYGDQVYFLSSDMRIYMLFGANAPVDISDPIRNWVDSIFVDRHMAYRKCRAFRLNDGIKFFNDSTGYGLNFNADRGQWSVEQYGSAGAYVPRGSFFFDTTEYSRFAWGDYGTSILFDDSAIALRIEGKNDTLDYTEPYFSTLQFSYYGDNDHLWMINSVDIFSEKTDRLYLQVFDEDGDLVATDTVMTDTVGSYGRAITYLPEHKGSALSLRLVSDTVLDGGWGYKNFIIYGIRITYQNMGGVNVR